MGKHGYAPPQPAVRGGQVLQETWQGPIPPPAALDAFRKLVPDAPERIIQMAEEEARIRRDQMQKDHDSENRTKETDIREYHAEVFRGQWMAFVLLLAIIGGAITCAVFNCEKAAIAIAAMGGVGIVSKFFWGSKK